MTTRASRLRTALEAEVDGLPLAIFRIVFGALLVIGTVRLLTKGYVHEAFVVPRTFFPPWPFEDVFRPLPGEGMTAIYVAIAILSLFVSIGFRTRTAALALSLLFTYAHFVDLTNYLNHYWLVTLLTALMGVVPGAGASLSIDAKLSGKSTTVPAWSIALLRFQVAVVYFFAGAAKLKYDWLVHAQPMRIWLLANTDVPLIGPLFRERWVAYAMSWTAAFYDLTIWAWLLWKPSRPFAYATVVTFHLLTARLFNIGMFPFFMIGASLLFLDAPWLRKHVPFLRDARVAIAETSRSRAPLGVLALYVAIQLLVPVRARLYGGNVLWHEQGYRFGWNVMLMEKMGSAQFTLVDRVTGAQRNVRIRDYLTSSQEKAMATQPDMILAFARKVAASERARGHDVEVHADVVVVLNGRPASPLVDPTIDLGALSDGFAPKTWILPAPR